MIDIEKKANEFWEKHSQNSKSENSLMNLESDEEKALEKFVLEKKHLESIVNFTERDIVVDLGAGIGLWSEYFAKIVKKVYLVEKQDSFIVLAQQRKENIELDNVEVIQSDVYEFDLEENSVDYIFLSGVTIYLSDNILDKLSKKMFRYLKPKGKLIHRDAYGREKQYVVNSYSEALGTNYTALYRTRKEYDAFFVEKVNFEKTYDSDMYDGGDDSPYNKWDETRLRLAIYQK